MTSPFPTMMNRIVFLSCLFMTSFMMVACEKGPEKKPIVVDPKYSVNVVPVPSFWPREKMDYPKKDEVLKNSMQRAHLEYGTPDYLRQVYTADRRIVRPSDLYEDTTLAGRVEERTEWIYLEEKLVLEFDRDRIKEHDLTDKLRIVCLYGDPNSVRDHKTEDGDIQKIFTFYEHGTFTFSDDKIVNQTTFFSKQSDTHLLRD